MGDLRRSFKIQFDKKIRNQESEPYQERKINESLWGIGNWEDQDERSEEAIGDPDREREPRESPINLSEEQEGKISRRTEALELLDRIANDFDSAQEEEKSRKGRESRKAALDLLNSVAKKVNGKKDQPELSVTPVVTWREEEYTERIRVAARAAGMTYEQWVDNAEWRARTGLYYRGG